MFVSVDDESAELLDPRIPTLFLTSAVSLPVYTRVYVYFRINFVSSGMVSVSVDILAVVSSAYV